MPGMETPASLDAAIFQKPGDEGTYGTSDIVGSKDNLMGAFAKGKDIRETYQKPGNAPPGP